LVEKLLGNSVSQPGSVLKKKFTMTSCYARSRHRWLPGKCHSKNWYPTEKQDRLVM